MSAVISPCGKYRYRLDRQIGMDGPVYAFFGVNPSTADASIDDATVRKWIGFCKRWGASRFIVGNVFSWRATDVRELATAPRIIGPMVENERHIAAMVSEADVLVPCWGDRAKVPSNRRSELDSMADFLIGIGKPVQCFGFTKSGDPKHPLMLGYDTQLIPWGKP